MGVVLNILFISGISQSTFFSFLFLFDKKRSNVDIIAGIWLFALAFEFMLVLIIEELTSFATSLFLSNLELLFTLVHGPFLFLYVKSLLNSKQFFTAKDYLHFLPFVLGLFYIVLFYMSDVSLFVPILGIISGLAYISMVIVKLRKLKNKDLSSKIKQNINWSWHLIIGLLFIWILPLLIANLCRHLQFGVTLNALYFMVPLFVFFISYMGIKKQIFFNKLAPIYTRQDNEEDSKTTNPDAYKNSALEANDMRIIFEALENSMREDKLFLKPDLTLPYLSDVLKIPPHYITQTLNIYSKQNLSEFVNTYRVNEFKKKLKSLEKMKFSLFGIATECGFNSKPSFNRIFKKYTGMTPSEYQRSN